MSNPTFPAVANEATLDDAPRPMAAAPSLRARPQSKVTPHGRTTRKDIAFLAGGLVLLWQIGTSLAPRRCSYLFPSPLQTIQALSLSLPELLRGTWSSFLVLIPGYLLACLFGIALGIVIGTTPRIARYAVPFTRVAAPVPTTIYVPYAIALLPGFRSAATFVVFVGAFWPILVNTIAGAEGVPQKYRDNAAVLSLSKFEYLVRVVLPSSLPHVFSGMSVGLALSFVLLTVAELFGANAGLGRFVQYYADMAEYPRMAAGILFTGAVTFAAMELIDRFKRRVLFWQI